MNTILQKDTNFKSHNLKNRLINNGLKENICEVCGINGVWNNKPITLELHHINGDHYDNRLENLQILSKALNISRPTVKKYLQQYDLLDILKSKYNFRAIPVNQYNSDMTIVKTWPSITDAENTLKIYGIEKVCKFKRNSAGGYIWRYA